jgi:2-polyprenyl-3-methyl-5-hydroxy-6-metoxy-1,4-benzoquinol methylase
MTASVRPDVQARTYGELFQFGGTPALVEREHRRLLPYLAGARNVLDVGCGRGVFLRLLREAGIEPAGVDIYAECVQQCQALGIAHVVQADALAYLRTLCEAFDGIVCSHIIEHLPYEDALALLRAAFTALRPGGRLIIVTPNPRDISVIGQSFWLDPTHVRPYPLALLAAMLRAEGFAIVHAAQPRSRPSKRLIPQWVVLSLLLNAYYARPNTLLVAEKPAVAGQAPSWRRRASAAGCVGWWQRLRQPE